jgi:geranylgeranyl diphosphate synthase, type II
MATTVTRDGQVRSPRRAAPGTPAPGTTGPGGERAGARLSAASRRRVEEALDRFRRVIDEALRAYLPDKEPRRYLYDLVSSYPHRAGKGLRPALCIASCLAHGGALHRVTRAAVAIELFHNAFLVHDDVEDGSEYRRGLPTLHAEHGLPIAVNVGDALNVMSIRPLMDNLGLLGPALTWQVFAEIEHMVRESVEGQAMELGWVRDNLCDLTETDYLRMTLKKTCWYTCMHPIRIGAVIGSEGTVQAGRFDRFGYYLGAAFQIQDDLLNLVGDRRKYGKEILGDIWEGKRTIMLIHLLQHAEPADRAHLEEFLATPRGGQDEREVQWVFGRMVEYGSLRFGRSCAARLAGAALGEFDRAFGHLMPNEHTEFLREIVLYMIERDL